MAQIDQSYTPPGVYTTTEYNAAPTNALTAARLPVLIGEAVESFTQSNVELHRGSSSVADDLVAGENISDQVTGSTRTYQLTYFPVVTGQGTGTVTNDPTKIKVTAGGVAVAVTSLVGATGVFQTQSIIPDGTDTVVSYYFKKVDTKVLNENLTPQIPAFASLQVAAPLTLSLSVPGALGNNVTFALTLASTGSGVSDVQAITGQNTDMISIELREPDDTVRSYADVVALIGAGVTTLSGGFLTIAIYDAAQAATAMSAFSATNFTAGQGQSTNTIFKTANVPIVDGTNGGVVTTNPKDVTVLVNGAPVKVTAVDGSTGLVTLAVGVAYAASLRITYFTNKYQDTSDALPSANVSGISLVGYGQNASNFVQGVDYVLNNNSVAWGASVNAVAGKSTAGHTPLDASAISTTLVDERVYMVPLTGIVSGRNSVFTLQDTPVDGSGLARSTDDPTKISIYVGPDPISALLAGPVRVSRLSGASAQVTLYNPPSLGQTVFGTYYRTTLNDHTFTLAVDTPGVPGVGTFTIADELGAVVSPVSVTATSVANGAFATTGIVWPSNFSDLTAGLGAAAETVKLTFQDDGLSTTNQQATQASLTVSDGGSTPRITFRATLPGTAGNAVTVTLVGGPTGAADASAIAVTGNSIVISTVKADNTSTRTWQDIVTLFTTYPVTISGAGLILCAGVTSADLTGQATSLTATHLAGGAAAVVTVFANRFLVTTSRTTQQAAADGLGLTGGATTPSGSNVGPDAVGLSGYLGQTYIDPRSNLKFTIVDPGAALSYGYTQLPSPRYTYAPGDTITITVNPAGSFLSGAVPTPAIPGIRTQVVTTLNMNPTDTAVVTTFNKAGNTPNVGDYYYVTYTVAKSATDFGLKVFSGKGAADAAYAIYGQPNSINNRLSIAIQLMVANGASQFGCIQVARQTGLGVASDQSFIDAIQTLATPIPGVGRKTGLPIALSTSATVQQAMSVFLTKNATARLKGEATSHVGFDTYTSANTIASVASSLANQRVIALTPPCLGYNIQGPTDTVPVEYPLTGEFLAAAVAGLALSPGVDVATTLTGLKVVGFTRSLVTYDEPTLNMLATAGVTCCIDVPGALEIRHYKTTDPSNDLTSEPYVTTTADYINQSFRKTLKQFVGRKETDDLESSIKLVLNSSLTGWLGSIIKGYKSVTVTQDPIDPTTFNIVVPILPMFSVLYLNVTLSVSLS